MKLTALIYTSLLILLFASMAQGNGKKELAVVSSQQSFDTCIYALGAKKPKVFNQPSPIDRLFDQIIATRASQGESQVYRGLEKALVDALVDKGVDKDVAEASLGLELLKKFQGLFRGFVFAQLKATGIESEADVYDFLESYIYTASETVRRDFVNAVLLRMVVTINPEINVAHKEGLKFQKDLRQSLGVSAEEFGQFLGVWSLVFGEGSFELLRAYLRLNIRNFALLYIESVQNQPTSYVGKKWAQWFSKSSLVIPKFALHEGLFLLDSLYLDKAYVAFSMNNLTTSRSAEYKSLAFQSLEKLSVLSVAVQNLFIERYFTSFALKELYYLQASGQLTEENSEKIAAFIQELEHFKKLQLEINEAHERFKQVEAEGKDYKPSLRLDRTEKDHLEAIYDVCAGVRGSFQLIPCVLKKLDLADGPSTKSERFLYMGNIFQAKYRTSHLYSEVPGVKEDLMRLISYAQENGVSREALEYHYRKIFQNTIGDEERPLTRYDRDVIVAMGDLDSTMRFTGKSLKQLKEEAIELSTQQAKYEEKIKAKYFTESGEFR